MDELDSLYLQQLKDRLGESAVKSLMDGALSREELSRGEESKKEISGKNKKQKKKGKKDVAKEEEPDDDDDE